MPAASLQEMARAAMSRYAHQVYSIGDLPYELCRSFLLRVRDAKQLREIEENSEDVLDKDGEVWQLILQAEFPGYQKYNDEQLTPNNPRSSEAWWKLYRYIRRKVEEDSHAAQERLKARLANVSDERSKIQTKIVGPDLSRSFAGNKTPFTRSYAKKPSATATPRRPFQPATMKIPHKVHLDKSLIAERKAAKEAQEAAKAMPKALRMENDTVSQLRPTTPTITTRGIFASSSKVRPPKTVRSIIRTPTPTQIHLTPNAAANLRRTVPTKALISLSDAAVSHRQTTSLTERPKTSATSSSSPHRMGTKATEPSVPDNSTPLKKRKRESGIFMPPQKRR